MEYKTIPNLYEALGIMLCISTNLPNADKVNVFPYTYTLFSCIRLKQYTIQYDGNKPIGFCVWGLLSKEALAIEQSKARWLTLDELGSGNILHILHLASPIGDKTELFKYVVNKGKIHD